MDFQRTPNKNWFNRRIIFEYFVSFLEEKELIFSEGQMIDVSVHDSQTLDDLLTEKDKKIGFICRQ